MRSWELCCSKMAAAHRVAVAARVRRGSFFEEYGAGLIHRDAKQLSSRRTNEDRNEDSRRHHRGPENLPWISTSPGDCRRTFLDNLALNHVGRGVPKLTATYDCQPFGALSGNSGIIDSTPDFGRTSTARWFGVGRSWGAQGPKIEPGPRGERHAGSAVHSRRRTEPTSGRWGGYVQSRRPQKNKSSIYCLDLKDQKGRAKGALQRELVSRRTER